MTAICSLAVFVSAFLLFSVQPMVAKMLLPSLGGSPSVWNTAMVFYQGALLLGYLYAHGVSRKLPRKAQLFVHGVALLLPFVVLPLAYGNLHPPATGNPSLWMLMTMALSVGLPFFVLSATSPLVQTWFAKHGGGDPYFLYAASNVGSFAGLLSYPLLIEPRLSVTEQSSQWMLGYIALVAIFVALIVVLLKRQPLTEKEAIVDDESITWTRRLRWIFLAFIPSSQFIGTTTFLTTDIAVMPLLWVIPLSIYLLTMIMVFAKRPAIPHKWIVLVFPYTLAGLTFMIAAQVAPFKMLAFGAHLIMLLVGALLCHGELAKDRPAPARLTEFFLLMSFGGVLGGLFNALVAPSLFVHVVEYSIVLALSAFALPIRSKVKEWAATAWDFAVPISVATLVMVIVWLKATETVAIPRTGISIAIAVGCGLVALCGNRPLRFAVGIASIMAVGYYHAVSSRHDLFAGRSFFGVYRVEMWGVSHTLTNGRILHGEQIMTRQLESVPLSYYHPLGPLKEIFGDWIRPKNARVAAIGLGTGTVSLWSRKGEHWTFFEIDPLVERIARDTKLFTCLANAQGKVDVTLGDARLRLEEPGDEFDLIVMDAFTSDAIPVHLMTLEAFRVYQSRLKETGFLAVHISNKFLSLEPLVAAISAQMGWEAYICDEANEPVIGPMLEGRTPASWMVVGPRSLDWKAFKSNARWRKAEMSADVVAWTDAYSSLMPLFRDGAFNLR